MIHAQIRYPIKIVRLMRKIKYKWLRVIILFFICWNIKMAWDDGLHGWWGDGGVKL